MDSQGGNASLINDAVQALLMAGAGKNRNDLRLHAAYILLRAAPVEGTTKQETI